MKKYVILIICLMLSTVIIGQTTAKSPMLNGQETSPIFTGSEYAAANLSADNSLFLNNYICKKLICPKKAVECCIEGTEIVKFTVTPTGELTSFIIVNGICPEIDKEVIRVLKTTNGMWMSGMNNGEPIAMEKEVTVLFGNCTAGNFENHFVAKATRYFRDGNKKFFYKHNPKKALKSYNLGIRYLPNDKALLTLRGLCHYELGDTESAEKDWNRMVSLGGIDPGTVEYNLEEMKGYSTMKNILAEK